VGGGGVTLTVMLAVGEDVSDVVDGGVAVLVLGGVGVDERVAGEVDVAEGGVGEKVAEGVAVAEGISVGGISRLVSDEYGSGDKGETAGRLLAIERLVEKGPSNSASTTIASMIRSERRFLERNNLASTKMPVGALV